MKIIPLTRGRFVIVDDEDFRGLNQYKWFALKGKYNYYAVRVIGHFGERKIVYMHREILNVPKGFEIDHIDGNGLNCQRENLRICTRAENNRNQRKMKGASKYKGVTWHPQTGKWRARIYKNKCFQLGLFQTEIEAAEIYNFNAKKLFGEFAFLNNVIRS